MGVMQSRKLDRRIRIERDGPVIHNGLQNVAGVPIVLAERWASMKPGGGRERLASAENAATAPMVLWIRWDPQLDPNAPGGVGVADRIRYPARDEGQIYDIKSAIEIGRRVGIEIAAVRRAG